MTERFTVDLLPALEGDAIWLEWGDEDRSGRMLIDGGRGATSRLCDRLAATFAARPDDRAFDVVVNTHMDADHIAGLIGLFVDPPDGFAASDIWFNGLRHIIEFDDGLGTAQSDRLEQLVERYTSMTGAGWNRAFAEDEAIVVREASVDGDDRSESLPRATVAGLTITLLSPTVDRLAKVATKWPELARRHAKQLAGIAVEEGEDPNEHTDVDPGADGSNASSDIDEPMDDGLGYAADRGVDPAELARLRYKRDGTVPNGGSIAFIAEFGGKRVLLAADAHAEVLEESLRRYQPTGKISLQAVKLGHHGSEKNLSPALLDMIDCPTWLISSNGSRNNHPDRRAMARIITRRRPAFLVFNYRSDMSREWGKASMQARFGHHCHLPPADEPGVRYDVMTDTAGPLPAPRAMAEPDPSPGI